MHPKNVRMANQREVPGEEEHREVGEAKEETEAAIEEMVEAEEKTIIGREATSPAVTTAKGPRRQSFYKSRKEGWSRKRFGT